MMGIQLGLTESGRCKPGRKLTELVTDAYCSCPWIPGLRCKISRQQKENIAKLQVMIPHHWKTLSQKQSPNEADYTPESWAAAKDSIANELEECEEMLANIKNQTTYGVEEQIGHLREVEHACKSSVSTVTPEGTADCNTSLGKADRNTDPGTANQAPTQPTATPAPTAALHKGITATAKASTIYTKGKTLYNHYGW